MIKVYEVKKDGQNGSLITLFADTRAEVPATGTATTALITTWGDAGALPVGSTIFTPAFDIGTLKSNGNWEWA